MAKEWKTKQIRELFKAISSLKNDKEAASFMRDLATLSELQAMAERWEVAQMVEKGVPYRDIAKKTGVSTATITRVAHWIRNGEGGYQKMLDRMKKA